MRVILKNEVHNLGDAGDIVKVADGYGRNFLLPRGLAVVANEGSVAQAEHNKKVAESIKKKQTAAARAIAEKLEGTAITLRREAGEDDRLFGAVTNRDIAEALAADGIQVDRKAIQLADPIKAIGLFNVPIRLHRQVTANVRVYVIRG